ncbi:MAG TPA: hypothetical protein PLK55_03945 [archaeon]|jgi:hypothetical protein|nr:hypothetical protein [archaeon]
MALEDLVKTMPKYTGIKEIIMNLNNYDDIFSDFDKKPYTHRSISDDFFAQLKKDCLEGDYKKLDLKIIVQKKNRNPRFEIIIRRRIEEHFKNHFKKLEKERKRLVKLGIIFLIFGAILLIFKYILAEGLNNSQFKILSIVLEPFSWFLFWEGAYILFFETKGNRIEYEIYKKLSKAKIQFISNDY